MSFEEAAYMGGGGTGGDKGQVVGASVRLDPRQGDGPVVAGPLAQGKAKNTAE